MKQSRLVPSACSFRIFLGVTLSVALWLVLRPAMSSVVGQGVNALVVVSAASVASTVAPDSIATIYGVGLATRIDAAASLPLPTQLAGTTVTIGGRPVPLFYVAPGQINCLIPADLPPGLQPVSVRASDGTVSQGQAQIGQVAPGIFTANASGQGRPAAQLVRSSDPMLRNLSDVPLDLGPANEQVYLVLYLTGLRRAVGNVRVLLGANNSVPDFVGAVGVGLDQVNVLIPRNLIGRGRVNVSVAVPGLALSNEVQLDIAGASGAGAPQISSFETAEAAAGDVAVINGNNFNPDPGKNLVRIGSLEASVLEASSGRLRVRVPYGAESGAVSVINEGREGRSTSNMTIKTSLSGFIEDTRRQPLRDVTIRLRDTGLPAIKTDAEGLFSFKNLPNLGALVEIEIDPSGAQQLGSLPFPRLIIKRSFRTGRDNYIERIPLQQESGPSVQIGVPVALVPEAPAQGGFARQIATGGVVLDVQTDTPALFPDGSTSGRLTLTIVADSRTPIALPPSEYSSSVVQLTPFNAKLQRGGKLTFPNPERFPPGTQAKLYRLVTPAEARETGFVEAGQAQVSADGLRIETAAGAIDTTSYYFVSLPRRATTVVGRVVDSDRQTPIRGALVSSRGQTALTDGDGGFVLRSVLVNEGDLLAVEAGYLRPNGRVDRGQLVGVPAVIDGLTTLTTAIALTSQANSRLPIVLAPDSLIISENEPKDVLLIAAHPDGGQLVSLEVSGAPFASLINNGGGLYTLRLRPGPNVGAGGTYTLRLIATDNLGLTASYEIKLTVNGRPIARIDTIVTSQNQPASFTLAGEDPEGYALSYVIVANPANGRLARAANSPNCVYTPNPGFVGSDQLIFKVNDALVDSLEARVTLIVGPPPNRPPVLSVPGPQTVAVNTPLNFTVTASDPDVNQTLTITAINRPGGSSFTQPSNTSTNATGQFSWTPSTTQVGTYTITFEVSDNGTPALKDIRNVMITVNTTNTAPVLAVPGAQTVSTGQALSFTVTASDVEAGQTFTLTASNLPSGASFTQSTATSGQFNWTPSTAQVGSYTISFRVVDNGSPALSDNKTVSITVQAAVPSWRQTSGPTSGEIMAFAVNGTNLFAGTASGGVFRSGDNGGNWTSVNTGLTNLSVNALAVKGVLLFAATNVGIFRSSDNGATWTRVYFGITNSTAYALAVNGSLIFASTPSGVISSDNNGGDWTPANTGLGTNFVITFAVNGTSLFAGTSSSGVFRSTNNGANWTTVNSGLTASYIGALVVNGTSLFAGTSPGNVFRSTNNGASWTSVNTGLPGSAVQALAVSGTQLFAGTGGGGVFRSSDNGVSWSAINNGLTNQSVRCLAVLGNMLFAGTNGAGVFALDLAANP